MTLRWFGISACTANPKGLSFITGTARFMLAIFYIVITPLSGHTWVPEIRSGPRLTELALGSEACGRVEADAVRVRLAVW
jgi:hypothetical protein